MPDAEKKLQLFLLPFAGGNSASFNKLEPLLDSRIEMHTIEYAGRLTRHREPFIQDYNDFIKDAAEQINRVRTSQPYAILGYSLGSVVVYDLVRQKMINGNPVHAFLCARGSVFKNSDSQNYAHLSDEEFNAKMKSLGGIDERILNNKRFLSIYMKPVRADYVIWSQYKFFEGVIPCSATLIYSPLDELSEGARDWEKLVQGRTDFYEMGENHFFIINHWKEIADIINSHLKEYIEK